jgi:SAM-dependent methyltransferase
MSGVRHSVELFTAFRHEATDPATFYGLLADDTVADIARFCQVYEATVLDVGGASGYVGDAFRAAGARAVTAEYDIDQMFEHGRTIVDGIIADGCALPIATGSFDVSYSSNVLEHVVSYRSMLAEMVRVVAPGGVIYLTFTNWLSPWGGHETSPWHYLGGEWSARRFERKTGAAPKNRFGVSLFRLDVRDVLAWCEACPDVEVLDTFPRYYPRWTKFLVKIPVVREFLTWNLVVVMRRSSRLVTEH